MAEKKPVKIKLSAVRRRPTKTQSSAKKPSYKKSFNNSMGQKRNFKKRKPVVDRGTYVVSCFFIRYNAKRNRTWVYPKMYRFLISGSIKQKIGHSSGLIMNNTNPDYNYKKANMVIASITKASAEDIKTYQKLNYYASFKPKGQEAAAIDRFRQNMINKMKAQTKQEEN